MKDLQTLNALSDSNRLLRDENKSLEEKVSYNVVMYSTCTSCTVHVHVCILVNDTVNVQQNTYKKHTCTCTCM